MKMTKDYIIIHPYNIFSQGNPDNPEYNEQFDIVDMYEIEQIDLTPYKCMILLNFVDQEFLYGKRHIIEQFLNSKKIVCFFGNLITKFLPGQQLFIPKEIRGHWDYNISIAKPHPIFEGVLEDDMTTNRGVKGFFARGHHPSPDGAEILLTLPDGETVTFIDRQSSNGTILMHSGGNLFKYARMGEQIENTTNRISPQLMNWVQEEFIRLQEGVKLNA